MTKVAGVEVSDVQMGRNAACPLISNVDREHTPLIDVLGDKVIVSGILDLSGAAATNFFWVADSAYTIVEGWLVYTEVSSADAGVNVKAGKLIVGTDDDDFFIVNVATEVSKEAGYRKAMTLASAVVAEGDVFSFTSAGSKTGTGEVMLQLVLKKA